MKGHFNQAGEVHMVDVGEKSVTRRVAKARGSLRIGPAQMEQLQSNALAKGDWKTTARIAGIQAAKRCSDLIPLCHPLPTDQVDFSITLCESELRVEVECTVTATAKTGVEMESLTGVSVALLTIYDMIKGIDKAAAIEDIVLLSKSGGKSGAWTRTATP
jgi:cyclic pyranopterin phosphate synthase